MTRALLSLAVLLALSPLPALADEATARATFKQAEDLRKAGKWAEACPLYQASYKDDPQLGVLLHLADCHQKIGKIATAWSEFTDAAELAHERSDSREAAARAAADALAPRLPKLHITPPPTPVPGLVVTRDGDDVTVLVDRDMPIDPGDHDIVASAPGYQPYKTKVTIIGEGKLSQLPLPPLEKTPEKPPVVPVAKPHEGKLNVTSQADAHIQLDSDDVGVGHYEGKVKSGGHQLRVTAPGMRPYQSEIVIADDETRTIDVPLEKEVVVVPVVPRGPHEELPGYELGLAFAPGVKGHGDHPAVLSYRLDFGFRIGHRVNLGIFAEYASVSASGRCGTDEPGAMPGSPYDFGVRYRFDSCLYVLAGLQLYVHILPKGRIDPYVGIAPGFRFGDVSYTPFDAAGMPLQPGSSSAFEPGIEATARAGVDYHPDPQMPGWAVGGYLDVQTMIFANEDLQDSRFGGRNGIGPYVSFFAGLRTSLAF